MEGAQEKRSVLLKTRKFKTRIVALLRRNHISFHKDIKIVPELGEKYKESKPKSKPAFLFYRDGKIVGEVLGCDAPAILSTSNVSLCLELYCQRYSLCRECTGGS